MIHFITVFFLCTVEKRHKSQVLIQKANFDLIFYCNKKLRFARVYHKFRGERANVKVYIYIYIYISADNAK